MKLKVVVSESRRHEFSLSTWASADAATGHQQCQGVDIGQVAVSRLRASISLVPQARQSLFAIQKNTLMVDDIYCKNTNLGSF